MSESTQGFGKRRAVWSAVAVVVLFGLWYAFRPEKLFINKKLDEPAPAALSQLTPLYTGSFQSDSHRTSGRATVYQQADGSRVLTLSNLATPNEPALDVVLLDGSTNERKLGELKAGQTEQNYTLPADVDFNRFSTVAIYSANLHTILGSAKLEAF